jgi:hypothetical protein
MGCYRILSVLTCTLFVRRWRASDLELIGLDEDPQAPRESHPLKKKKGMVLHYAKDIPVCIPKGFAVFSAFRKACAWISPNVIGRFRTWIHFLSVYSAKRPLNALFVPDKTLT